MPKRARTPEPWVRRLTEDKLAHYYLNKITGETQWTLPTTTIGTTNSSTSSLVMTSTTNGGDAFQRMRSDSDLSRTSRRDSVYSDGSDVQPSRRERGTDFTPLQRSIDQARKDGTIELTAAEQAAHSLQQAMAAPQPQSVRELMDAIEHAISSVVDFAQTPDFPNAPEHIMGIHERVGHVVNTVRDLLYISALPSGTIPPEVLPPGSAPTGVGQSTQAQLKPAQRKVTATLSKLVLSVRALGYDSEVPMRDAGARLEGDAVDLTQALSAFAMDVQRVHRHSRIGAKRVYGVFSPDNIGFSLPGGGAAASWKGFGWVALDIESEVPKQTLGVQVIAESKQSVAQLSDSLNGFSAMLQSHSRQTLTQVTGYARDIIAGFSAFLLFVADVHVARHVDIDGYPAAPMTQSTAIDAYMRTVKDARGLVRRLEAMVQAIYDDSALLLTHTQALRQAHLDQPGHNAPRALASLADTLAANAASVQTALESLVSLGVEQARLASGDYRASIDRRMSRVSVIESTLRPLLSPHANAKFSGSAIDDDEDMVDLERAFQRTAGGGVPPFDDGYRANSDQSHSPTEEMPPTPTWNASEPTAGGSSFAPTERGEFESELSPIDDEDVVPGPSKKKAGKNLERWLGSDAPQHYIKNQNPEATPWYLRSSVNPQELVMDASDGSIKAGTITALIERLTAQDNTGRLTFPHCHCNYLIPLQILNSSKRL